MLKSFKDLEVWRRSHQIVLEIYRLTNAFPKEERFGITSQLRRAAYSVPGGRIWPAFDKGIDPMFGNREWVTRRSALFRVFELDLGYLPTDELESLDNQLNSVAQMIAALSRTLKHKLALRFGNARVMGYGSRVTH